jgi:8-amino-3,8-dideoxy-alpha-D-manno-octulosonate transaminase
LSPGVEVGARSILGLNFRMNELTGAVALAQLRKLDAILATLREKKSRFKSRIADIPGVRFRALPDADGECATLCTVIFESPDRAAAVAARLGTTTVARSGWHVYANMEHVGRWLAEHGRPSGRGAYPRTDDILSRSINLSVGVVDAGLGSAFGIHIRSSEAEIEEAARAFRAACAAC